MYFRSVYDRLNVKLTPEDDAGESIYSDMLQDTIDELQSKGLLHESDGALCAFPSGFVGRDGEPFPLIVRKRDGGYGYDTTDLAAIRYRIRELRADYLIYVTDARQGQHFSMIFQTAREAGWLTDGITAVHVGYGMVLGDDGKPFKTRSGEVVQLATLIDEAVARAGSAMSERNADMDDAERAALASAVGVGAIKWFDLKNEHTNNYVFDFDRMLAFNGNTGPYVQYASTRAKSVLRKAGASVASSPTFVITEEKERQLALHLPEFETAVAIAADSLEPHHLCTYLYELAERFTAFYESCPVLTAPDEWVRESRLSLCALTARVIDTGLDLLGISPVDRM